MTTNNKKIDDLTAIATANQNTLAALEKIFGKNSLIYKTHFLATSAQSLKNSEPAQAAEQGRRGAAQASEALSARRNLPHYAQKKDDKTGTFLSAAQLATAKFPVVSAAIGGFSLVRETLSGSEWNDFTNKLEYYENISNSSFSNIDDMRISKAKLLYPKAANIPEEIERTLVDIEKTRKRVESGKRYLEHVYSLVKDHEKNPYDVTDRRNPHTLHRGSVKTSTGHSVSFDGNSSKIEASLQTLATDLEQLALLTDTLNNLKNIYRGNLPRLAEKIHPTQSQPTSVSPPASQKSSAPTIKNNGRSSGSSLSVGKQTAPGAWRRSVGKRDGSGLGRRLRPRLDREYQRERR